MNDYPSDAQTKALEFVNSASTYVLIATIALTAWVASGVEFSSEGLRVTSMACLTLSAVFGIATLALIPLVQEARQPGNPISMSRRTSSFSGGAAHISRRCCSHNTFCCWLG